MEVFQFSDELADDGLVLEANASTITTNAQLGDGVQGGLGFVYIFFFFIAKYVPRSSRQEDHMKTS